MTYGKLVDIRMKPVIRFKEKPMFKIKGEIKDLPLAFFEGRLHALYGDTIYYPMGAWATDKEDYFDLDKYKKPESVEAVEKRLSSETLGRVYFGTCYHEGARAYSFEEFLDKVSPTPMEGDWERLRSLRTIIVDDEIEFETGYVEAYEEVCYQLAVHAGVEKVKEMAKKKLGDEWTTTSGLVLPIDEFSDPENIEELRSQLSSVS